MKSGIKKILIFVGLLLLCTVTNVNASAESTVRVMNVDESTNQPLAGTLLVLKNKEGKTITSWISTIKVHQIKNLPNGSYTLSQTQVPEGYQITELAIPFIITEENKNIVIKVRNKKSDSVTDPTIVEPKSTDSTTSNANRPEEKKEEKQQNKETENKNIETTSVPDTAASSMVYGIGILVLLSGIGVVIYHHAKR